MDDKEKQKKDIGSRISVIRKELGKTMKEFGELFNPPASDSIVSRWERGISTPNNDRLQKIAAIGNVSIMYLTTGQKSFRDLTDQEIINSLNEIIEIFKKHNYKPKENLRKEFEDDDLGAIETVYLFNALDFLKYADTNYIQFLDNLIHSLIKLDELKKNEKYNNKDLEESIVNEVSYIENFLRERFLKK